MTIEITEAERVLLLDAIDDAAESLTKQARRAAESKNPRVRASHATALSAQYESLRAKVAGEAAA